jgi:hypothetical protein
MIDARMLSALFAQVGERESGASWFWGVLAVVVVLGLIFGAMNEVSRRNRTRLR